MFTLIVNPTYKCGFDCNFCYVKKEQEKYDNKLLNVNALDDVFKNYEIGKVVISGGEPTNCDYDYIVSLINKIKEYYKDEIDFETNFYNVEYCRKLQESTGVNIVVGYDFHVRPYANDIWEKMYEYPLPFDIKICATHFVVKSFHPNLVLKKFTLLRNLKNFEIVRYMKNFTSQWKVETHLYEKYIRLFFDSEIETKNKCKNYTKIINGTYKNRPLIINPDGLLYVQKADTIVEQVPYVGEVPALDDEFATYTSELVRSVLDD